MMSLGATVDEYGSLGVSRSLMWEPPFDGTRAGQDYAWHVDRMIGGDLCTTAMFPIGESNHRFYLNHDLEGN